MLIYKGVKKVNMKKFIPIFLLCLSPVILKAQSTAEEIEALLETEAVTYAQAARFIMEAADIITSSGAALSGGWFEYAMEQKWLPRNTSANQRARLDRIALLVMRSFDIKGGYFYSIFKSPHYAYHELLYKRVIQGRADPAMAVSGSNLLFITSRALNLKEQER